MTIKDWIYLAITVASWVIAVIAGIYAKDKQKINRATKMGQILDAVGKLATYAVHETEYSGMDNEDKREAAAEIINQGLNWFGIKDVTPQVVNGAIEKAVNAMHLANDDPGTPEVAKDVKAQDIVQPTAPQASNPERENVNA